MPSNRSKGMDMAKNSFALWAAIALGVSPQAGLLAQENDGTIVVTGQRQAEPREVRSQARAITPRGASHGEPLARFQRPICVAVWGLGQESAQFIIDRIYFNAERVGVEVNAEVGCAPNILALFVADPESEVEELLEADHYLVRGLSFWDRKRLRQQSGKVRCWNTVVKRTADGHSRDGDPPVFDSTSISRLNSAIRVDLDVSVVMIDNKALADKDSLAVADYITMRSLARTLPPDEDDATLRTILSLFDEGGSTTMELTAFDQAYLTEVYASRANLPSGMALNNLQGIIEQIEERGQ